MSIRYSLRAANGQEHPITGPFRIGRDPQCQILIDNHLISRLHASIWIDHDHLLLRDERSRNGTQVNGRALPPGETHYLHHGDQVRVGDTTFFVESDPPSPAAGQPAAGFEPPVTAHLEAGAPAAAPRRLPALPLAIGGCLALVLLAACCALGFFAMTAGRPIIATVLAPPVRRSATPAPAGAFDPAQPDSGGREDATPPAPHPDLVYARSKEGRRKPVRVPQTLRVWSFAKLSP